MGPRDDENGYIRSDAPCMNFEIFRLVLSIAAESHWPIGQIDVKAAFLQAKGFDQDMQDVQKNRHFSKCSYLMVTRWDTVNPLCISYIAQKRMLWAKECYFLLRSCSVIVIE